MSLIEIHIGIMTASVIIIMNDYNNFSPGPDGFSYILLTPIKPLNMLT